VLSAALRCRGGCTGEQCSWVLAARSENGCSAGLRAVERCVCGRLLSGQPVYCVVLAVFRCCDICAGSLSRECCRYVLMVVLCC